MSALPTQTRPTPNGVIAEAVRAYLNGAYNAIFNSAADAALTALTDAGYAVVSQGCGTRSAATLDYVMACIQGDRFKDAMGTTAEDYVQWSLGQSAPLYHYESFADIVAERDALRQALTTAADDLDKATNQFAGLRASQQAGHTPDININPEVFAKKAERARALLTIDGHESDKEGGSR